jgi:hypothetical protein
MKGRIMKQVNEFWEASKAPTIFHLEDIQRKQFDPKVQSILEAIFERDCQSCLLRAKLDLFAEVIKGNLSLLEGTLLDSLLQDSANWAIQGWIEDFIGLEDSAEDAPSDEDIKKYVEHLELFEMQMAVSFIDWRSDEDI